MDWSLAKYGNSKAWPSFYPQRLPPCWRVLQRIMDPFVLTPVDKEAVRCCEVTKPHHSATAVTPVQVTAETRYSVWSVLFLCQFYKLTREGAIVPDWLQSGHWWNRMCEEKYQTGWQDKRHTTSGRKSKLYIFKCKNQTDKIFVNIKFPVCFFFSFSFFFFLSEWMKCLFCDNKRQQVQFAKKKCHYLEVSNSFFSIIELKSNFILYLLSSHCSLSHGHPVASWIRKVTVAEFIPLRHDMRV